MSRPSRRGIDGLPALLRSPRPTQSTAARPTPTRKLDGPAAARWRAGPRQRAASRRGRARPLAPPAPARCSAWWSPSQCTRGCTRGWSGCRRSRPPRPSWRPGGPAGAPCHRGHVEDSRRRLRRNPGGHRRSSTSANLPPRPGSLPAIVCSRSRIAFGSTATLAACPRLRPPWPLRGMAIRVGGGPSEVIEDLPWRLRRPCTQ
mmetsp:Transcript_16102/g.44527  ORF Transcript_16102/g.44527 Transcript_16102/m.44527 type:complete len:203 (+) Transcript_16102:612-1220(+)